MKATIITIGDEILIGQIVDTNSAWMSQKLTDAGFEVVEILSIGDNADQIKTTIDKAFSTSDAVLVTGGIGPTKDDITKKTLCEYFHTELVFNDEVLENIKQVVSHFTSVNPLTQAQAYVPKSCTVIQNRVGTAPITWFDHQGKILVSMPGVPYEMKYVMENEILPRMIQKFETEAYLKKILLIRGYTESALAIYLTDFENNLPDGFGLAYLPSPGLIKLRLFVRGDQRKEEFEAEVEKLRNLLGNAILIEDDLSPQQVLAQQLKSKGLTLSTAESCTGGNIAHLITQMTGASEYFKGTVVSYTNEIKENVLKVSPELISQHTAVSESVVEAMAKGVKDLMSSDCVIAVSGIAGPDGGTEDIPVGTIWICTMLGEKSIARKYQFGKYRESNITRASNAAIFQLLEMME